MLTTRPKRRSYIYIYIYNYYYYYYDYLRKSTTVSRLQKIPNTAIRTKMQAEQSILDRIQRRQLKWYGHLLRMEDSRWSKKIYQWTPHGRRRRGRPQQSWRNQVTDFMKSRNMEEDKQKKGIFDVWEWMDGSWLYRSHI